MPLTGAGLASLAACSVMVACSFPDIDITGGGGQASTTSSRASGGQSTATTDGTGTTGSAADVSSSTGAGCVDLDLDGASVGDCCTVGVDCDCDDDDDLVFPAQTGFFWEPRKNVPSGPMAFDYDCNGTIKTEYDYGACGNLSCPGDTKIYFDLDNMEPQACGSEGVRRFCSGGTCSTDAGVEITPERTHVRCH